MGKLCEYPIISFDFDETITNVGYAELNAAYEKGEDMALYVNEWAIETLKKLHRDGCIILIFTCRTDKHDLWIVKEVLKRMEVYQMVEAINENAKIIIQKYGDSRKVFADFYIDNCNVCMSDWDFSDYLVWEKIYEHIVNNDSHYVMTFSGKSKKKGNRWT